MLDTLLTLVGLCFYAFVVFGIYVTLEACYYQLWLGDRLRRELGFAHGSAYVRCGRTWEGVVTIASLAPGGVFAQAGFREGDILKGLSFSGLYKILHRCRGSEIRLTVIEDGNDLPLGQRPERQITVYIPPPGEPPAG